MMMEKPCAHAMIGVLKLKIPYAAQTEQITLTSVFLRLQLVGKVGNLQWLTTDLVEVGPDKKLTVEKGFCSRTTFCHFSLTFFHIIVSFQCFDLTTTSMLATEHYI